MAQPPGLTGAFAYPPRRVSLIMRSLLCVAALGLIAWTFTVAPSTRYVSLAILAVCAVLIAYAALGFLSQIFDGKGLITYDQGFSFRGFWQRQFYRWNEVSEFQVVQYRTIRVVGFDVPDSDQTTVRRINRNAIGMSDFIFAHSFQDLEDTICEVLNERRRRALESG